MSKQPEVGNEGASCCKLDALYWSFMLMGCGVLTPYNALLSAVDYFDGVYPDYNALRWICVTYLSLLTLTLVVCGFAPAKKRGKNRITLGFNLSAFTMALIPVSDLMFIKHERGMNFTFALLIVCTGLLAVAAGITEGSLVGLATYMPLKYCQAHLGGCASSGIVIVSLRAITKASLTDSAEGLRISACIFFFLSSALSMASYLVYKFIITRSSLFQYQSIADDDELSASLIIPRNYEIADVTVSDFLGIASKMKLASLNIVIAATVSATIFPGVATDVESEALGDWYGVMLVAFYAVADFVSRVVPTDYVSTNLRLITCLNVARISLIPITFVAVHEFSNPVSISLLMFIIAFSNGYIFICGFAMGQEKMEGNDESFIAGNLLVASLICGLGLGSGFSLVWSRID